ncbi:DUF5958 family protein [Streptomyces longispororuber]|uniref:DUF5958 family protein n=1 Tax=Streptomyces longispororuber TaxID=68230 RepID=UPI0033F7BA8D
MAEGIERFESLTEVDQRRVLHALVLFSRQARAHQEYVPESITRSGIRPTHTPAVMLANWRFGMKALPAYELTKPCSACSSPSSVSLIPAGGRCTALRRRMWSCVAQPAGSATGRNLRSLPQREAVSPWSGGQT